MKQEFFASVSARAAHISYLWAAAAALLVSAGGHAFAQSAADSPTAAAGQTAALDEIVVTATRREQSLQNVPIAITALTGDSLSQLNIISTADLMTAVPNLNISSQVGATIVYLRGVGQAATNAGQEPSVATYIDGVYQPTVFGALTNLANVQRVEVIKGPQGTLFGRNATGGLINVVTRDPSQTPEADVDLSYGNYNTAKFSGYGTTGITENIAADLAIFYYDQIDGIGHDLFTGREENGTRNIDVRSKVLFTPTDTTKIRLSGDYSDNSGSSGNNMAILRGSVAFNGNTALPNFYDINGNIDPYNHNSTYQAAVRVDQELNPFNIVSISAYTHTQDKEFEDDEGTPVPLINVYLSQMANVFTQEFQLVSKKDSPLTWLVGAFYYNSDAKGEPTGTGLSGLAFGGGGENSRANLKTESIAGYGEVTYEILPKLDLTVGGRYTRDKKTLSGGLDITDSSGAVISTTPVTPVTATFKDPTYRGILDYHFTSDVMGYVSYSRGFKSGGFDTGFPTGVAFKPEILDAYEAGLKTSFFNQLLHVNIAGFHYNYKDLQLPILVNIDGNVSQITVNATSAKVNGMDLDGTLRITQNLNFNFGLGYLDSKYGDFNDAPCTLRTAAGATQQYICDATGNTTTHAPKVTSNVGGTYGVPTSFGLVALTVTYSYMTRYFFTPDDRLYQPGYGLLNGQLGWTNNAGNTTVSLYAENMLSKQYTIAQYAQDTLGDTYVAGRPAIYGIEARMKFK